MTTPADRGVISDPLFDVSGKIVLVTGGSRGVGAMIAEGLVRRGATVVITSRNREACERTAAQLTELGSCTGLATNLADDAAMDELVLWLRENHGGLDVLVNNAGASWGAPIDEYPMSGFDKVIAVNLRAVFRLSQACLPLLESRATAADPARIIAIGSIDGLVTSEGEAYAYGASKAAVHHLTRQLARHLAGRHVLANSIAPGPFYSKMMAFLLDDPAGRESVEHAVPLGRIGSPDDIVGAVVYLASRASSYVTGTTLVVDGGSSSCR
jgi:NAD(P)-dependent dehydrogenase (short-subunit alcohol dehydrogenase family)